MSILSGPALPETAAKPSPSTPDLEKDLVVRACTPAPDGVKDWTPVPALAKARSDQEAAPQTVKRTGSLLHAVQADEAARILTGKIRDSHYRAGALGG
jgi:hypothetical protein